MKPLQNSLQIPALKKFRQIDEFLASGVAMVHLKTIAKNLCKNPLQKTFAKNLCKQPLQNPGLLKFRQFDEKSVQTLF